MVRTTCCNSWNHEFRMFISLYAKPQAHLAYSRIIIRKTNPILAVRSGRNSYKVKDQTPFHTGPLLKFLYHTPHTPTSILLLWKGWPEIILYSQSSSGVRLETASLNFDTNWNLSLDLATDLGLSGLVFRLNHPTLWKESVVWWATCTGTGSRGTSEGLFD